MSQVLRRSIISACWSSAEARDRDAGLLESAVMRAENKAYFDPDATLGAIAATLGYGLIKNHAFIDGNKRVGLAATVALLWVNGFRLVAPTEEQIAVVQGVAASEVSEQAWTSWVEEHIKPIANAD